MDTRTRRRGALTLCVLGLLTLAAPGQTDVRIGVLGLFHPRELVLEAVGFDVVSVTGRGAPLIVNGEPGHRQVLFRAEGDRVFANGVYAPVWTATARDLAPTAFRLGVRGRIRRAYRGRLTIAAHRGELLAIVAMDREQAVASILAAEMADAPAEALKAQAVVTRSFLAAGGRHRGFDFCDTTHCQFLRSPDDATTPVNDAVKDTRGLILTWRQKPLAALYSSRCGGTTHSLREVGLRDAEGYPYFAVPCPYCRQSLFRWQRRLDPSAPAPAHGNEPARIAHARLWGWSALPGGDFTIGSDAAGRVIEGRSVGHGVGMCQFGASGMARAGADFRAILAHYYPDTEIATLPSPASGR